MKLKINRYGNVDVRKKLPTGYVHVMGKRLAPIARRMGAKYFAPAFEGWDGNGRNFRPSLNGIVCTRNMAKKIKVELERLNMEREVRESKQKQAKELRQQRHNLLLAESIRALFPFAPKGEEEIIASRDPRDGRWSLLWAYEWGINKHSRRSDLQIDEEAHLFTVAHICHNHTEYKERVRNSYGHGKREICRKEVAPQIKKVITAWKEGETA
tara:strand:+ start:51 stop:686 length:636 start_codon:yes stop_codon:yes gene_type:complete